MKFKIEGQNFPVLICTLDSGEAMITQSGGMAWMTPSIEMKTEGGGGLGGALGRMLSGESIFRNIYTAKEDNSLIAFNTSAPGQIIPVEITLEKPLIVQKSSFLASTPGIKTEMFFRKQLMSGFFGGEGFIMQKISGEGTVFIEVFGSALEYNLKKNESMLIDTGSLAFMDSTCTMDVKTVKGMKNILFGGEGLFLTSITGPGKVAVQTMQIPELAKMIIPYLPQKSN